MNVALNRFVVIDFETTGNHPERGDSIIQIGAVTIDDGKIADRFSTYVNPLRPIPAAITALTGITDDMVAEAPQIEDVLPQLLRLLDQRTLVAHNAPFDLSFLQQALHSQGYYTFSGYVLDTVELARLLFPTQGSYRLVELAEQFVIRHDQPHQADSDALATAELFLRILQFLEQLPLVTIQRLQLLVTTFRSDVGELLRSIEREKWAERVTQDGPPVDVSASWDIYRQLALRPRPTKTQLAHEEAADSLEWDGLLEQLLGEAGWLTRVHPGYQRRETQEAMMRAIYDAMHDGQHLLVEAGTGTGKTIAYLVPAILWAKQKRQQVVISTHTIHLQDQLFHQELPMLKAALPFSFTAALLKGRGNYLCLRKLEQQLDDRTPDTHEQQLTKAQLVSWLAQTETGDVEELNLSPVGNLYWQQVKSDVHSCMHRRCPWFSRCYYFRAREAAKDADLVIVNHALLLNDLEAENRILPAYEVAIVDEAHQLEEVASQQLGAQYSTARLTLLVERLLVEEEHDLVNRLVEVAVQWMPDLQAVTAEAKRRLAERAQDCRDCLQRWSGELYSWAAGKSGEQTEVGRLAVRYQPAAFTGKTERLTGETRQLVDALVAYGQTLEQLLAQVKGHDETPPHALRSLLTDAEGLLEDLKAALDVLFFLLLDGSPDYVYWMELETRSPRKHVYLYAAPLNVSHVLADKLFAKKRSVTLTSATLTVKNSFDYYLERHGLDKSERIRTLILPSPFAYEKQGLILLPNDFPALGKEAEETFREAVIQGCADVIRAAKGRTLILFTSYAMLRGVYEGLKRVLDTEGFTLLGHGIDSNNRSKLVRQFRRLPKAVLLGASSFWEGVDIPGEALSCVVIVRLPFQPPTQPLLQGRAETLKAAGKNPFLSLSLPHAVIRFKQGLGRLIRHQTDNGVIVVFDTRIVESRYGKAFLDSLPPYRIETGAWHELREQISSYLEGMQRDTDS